jgi:pyridoxine 5-phosphate synthase
MRGLILELDALASLREATGARDVDLAAAATLAELAGVDAVRLGASPDRSPVTEEDLRDTRRAARRLELRMPPIDAMVRIALDVRPDLVLLASDRREGASAVSPLDWKDAAGLGQVARALTDAGIAVAARVAPTLDAVKAAHRAGVSGVELYTGTLVDLPGAERRRELQQLGDAARLASKLRLSLGVGGGLGYHALPEVVQAAPSAEHLAVGRGALARAMLVGLARALRDLRALLA